MLLTAAGFQVPVMLGLFVEEVGNVGAAVPEQKAGTALKVGVTGGFTVTLSVAVVAHCPAVGVKV